MFFFLLPLILCNKVFSQFCTGPDYLFLSLSNTDSLQVAVRIQALIEKYRNKAYLAASADSVYYVNDSVYVCIYTGPRYRWLQINRGNGVDADLRRANVNLYSYRNKLVKSKKFYTLHKKIVSWYENHGYPFVAVSLKNVQIENNRVTASLHVEKKDYFIIDSIVVKGTKAIKDNYIRHYLAIIPGSMYEQKKIDRIDGRLQQLLFLEPIRPHQVEYGQEKASIYTYLKSRRANYFSGLVGFMPGENNSLLLTGEVNMSLANALGYGEEAWLEWRKLSALSQKMNAGFVYPYVFSSFAGLDFSLGLLKQDSTYLTAHAVYGLRWYNGGHNHFRFFYEQKSSSLLSSNIFSDAASSATAIDFRRGITGFGVVQSNTDNRFNPYKGYMLNIHVGYGTKRARLEMTDSTSLRFVNRQTESLLHTALFVPTGTHTTIKIANRSGLLYILRSEKNNPLSNELFDNELFRIGGLKSLRGFDEEALFASSYTVFSFEYRFLFDKNSCFYPFVDAAYYERSTVTGLVSDYPIGMGIGIDMETRAGILTINYAVGRQFNNPIDLRAAKIHLGLINCF